MHVFAELHCNPPQLGIVDGKPNAAHGTLGLPTPTFPQICPENVTSNSAIVVKDLKLF